jgi:hypothetical protein
VPSALRLTASSVTLQNGACPIQTRANDQRASDRNVQATNNTVVDPNELAPAHPHWQIWRGGPRWSLSFVVGFRAMEGERGRSRGIPIWVWVLTGLGAIAGLSANGDAVDAMVGGVIWFGIGLFLAWLFRVLFRRRPRPASEGIGRDVEATSSTGAPPPPPPSSFCPHCGAAVTVDAAAFCPGCGKPLDHRK